jgi:hypothetical protein
MKTISSLTLGTLSSLLLTAGMKEAAQKLDPLSRLVAGHDHHDSSMEPTASNCISPCMFKHGIE